MKIYEFTEDALRCVGSIKIGKTILGSIPDFLLDYLNSWVRKGVVEKKISGVDGEIIWDGKRKILWKDEPFEFLETVLENHPNRYKLEKESAE